jgi:aspartate aminotransferase
VTETSSSAPGLPIDYESQRCRGVRRSPTVVMAGRAGQLRREGRDIASLSVGEPDFPVPDHVREALIEAVRQGLTRYTPSAGTPELREAIVERTLAESRLSFTPGQVIVSAGAKQSLYNACAALLDPGDEAVIPNPYWVSYPDMVKLSGGVPVELRTSAAEGWQPTGEALAAAMSPRTKLVIFGSPSNPTGAVWSEATLLALAEVLRRFPRAVVLTDDIYGRILYGVPAGQRAPTLLQVAPDLAPRTIVVDGCSKAYAMTGLRIGWSLAPEPLTTAMIKVQDASTTNPNSVAQQGAIAALRGPQEPVERMIRAWERRRGLLLAQLAVGGVHAVRPDGAFYAFVDVRPWLGRSLRGAKVESTWRLAELLLEEHGVATVSGAAFGCEGYLRLSFATSDEEIGKATSRILAGLASLS